MKPSLIEDFHHVLMAVVALFEIVHPLRTELHISLVKRAIDARPVAAT